MRAGFRLWLRLRFRLWLPLRLLLQLRGRSGEGRARPLATCDPRERVALTSIPLSIIAVSVGASS